MKVAVFWVVALCGALMMEAVRTSETSVNFYQNIMHYNPEDSQLQIIKLLLDDCCFPRFLQTLTVGFLLGSNFFEYDEVLMRYFRCYINVLRIHWHEVRLPVLDLFQAVHPLQLTKHYNIQHTAVHDVSSLT
jgi:hypothetical protein